MKVNRDLRLPASEIHPEQKFVPQNRIPFQQLIKNHTQQIQSGQLQYLLTEIEKASDRLAKSKNFRDLIKYKNLVKKFIAEAVDNGLKLKKTYTWDEFGQNRTLKIIEQIDEKLLQLIDEVLTKEKENIKILGLLGEIKGLLINLYT